MWTRFLLWLDRISVCGCWWLIGLFLLVFWACAILGLYIWQLN